MLELLEEEHGKEEATIASIKEADEARMLSVTFCRLLLGGGVAVLGVLMTTFWREYNLHTEKHHKGIYICSTSCER